MNTNHKAYGKLCSLFYDTHKKYAPEPEVNFYANHITNNPGRVLEAMSGSGRLQIPLIVRGYIVDGVDDSASMLARCQERCKNLGIAPELYEQSLENFSSPHRYAVVTIAVGSFQLIVDRNAAVAALQNLRTHMIDGGTLLLDIFVPDVHQDPYEMVQVRIDASTVIRLTKRHLFDTQQKIASTFCFYQLLVNGEVVEEQDELTESRWYSDQEWQELLQQTGFEIVAWHDQVFRASGPSRIIEAISQC